MQTLQKLGLSFEMHDEWERHFQEVAQYFTEHQTIRLPKGFISESGINLYQWLADQKKKYKKGKLPEAQAAKLRSIGIPI